MKCKLYFKAIGLLFAACCFFPQSLRAGVHTDDGVYYVGEYHLGYGTSSSVNGYSTYTGNVMLGTIQGVQFLKYAQLGIGVDARMLTHYYKGQGIRYGFRGYGDARFLYPVNEDFAAMIGGSFGVDYSIEPSGGDTPFYMEIGPGIIYKKSVLVMGRVIFL